MKKIFLLLGSAAILPMFLLLTAYNGGVDRSKGGVWENTGSPGDGSDCTACHSGSATTDNGWLTTDIPATGYVPGQTYTITVATTGGASSNKKGFSIVCENNATSMGTFVTTDATNTVYFSDHMSHTETGTNVASWTMDWTAPASGSGEVTFYTSTVFDGYGGGVVNATASFVEFTTGVNELSLNAELQLFPNPVSSQLNVSVQSGLNETVSMSIYTITGKRMEQRNVTVSANSLNTSVDVSSYEPGIYLIQIQGKNASFTKRFVVE